jgi:intraflagellar transport protein 140
MSVYFSHRVVVPPVEQGQASYLDVSWHPHCSILAVVSRYESSGAVFFCHDEGELIEDMNVAKPWFVESISWHPDKKFLAVGWKNGEITICNITDSDIHSHPPFHRTPVNILQWTNTGSHLISADISGVIAMWKVEPSGLLAKNPFQQAKLTGEITHCVLLSGASKALQTKFKSSDAVVCIFALKDGQLCLWNSGNKCTELENFHSLIVHLEYSAEKSLLAALTKTMVLVLMTTQNDSFQKLSEVKLGGQGIVSSMIWTLPGVLTTCSDEPLIRFWDTVDNENYSLSLKDYFTIGKEELHECVTAISYQSNGSYLSAGTNKGHVIIWYWNNDQWKFVTYFTLDQSINALSWEYSRRSLAMSHDSHVDIAIEHPIASHYNQEVSAVQVSAHCVMVQSHANNSTVKFSTDIMISGIATTKTHTVVWDGKKVNVYSISFSKNLANMSGTFQSVATSVAIYEHSVFTVEEDHLIVRSVASVIKHKLSLAMEISGSVHLRISGHYLGLAVSNGYVKAYNLARREPKLMCTKSLSQSVDGFRSVLSCQTNSNGTMISSIVKTVSDVSVMTLMNCDNETVKVLSFSQGRPSSISLPANLPEAIMKDQSKMLSQLNGGDVVMVHWDGNDPRLLAIEVQVDPNSRHSYAQKSPTHLVMLFITADMHFLVQEVSTINPEFYSTIGCNASYVYYTTKNMAVPSLPAETNRGTDSIPLPAQRAPLKDFIGLGDCDEPMVKAMLSFSYSSLMGNMDDAFKAIKSIKNQRVWKTLAVMSVKTRRFDVALVCVGNMNDGRAAKAIREAQEIPEEDARLATLAVHLGMLDTAEELYISSGRYDLLNLFYQASGKWMKVI